jgi:hypothetical protein
MTGSLTSYEKCIALLTILSHSLEFDLTVRPLRTAAVTSDLSAANDICQAGVSGVSLAGLRHNRVITWLLYVEDLHQTLSGIFNFGPY